MAAPTRAVLGLFKNASDIYFAHSTFCVNILKRVKIVWSWLSDLLMNQQKIKFGLFAVITAVESLQKIKN